MRTETIGNATLYLGDCREIMPTLPKPDAVVTDPPYGISADTNNSKPPDDPNGWRHYGAPTGWDDDRQVEAVKMILGLGVQTMIWGGNYYADVLPPSMGFLIWDKGQEGFSLADVEMAWWSEWRAARRILYPRALAIAEGGEHPTQKPIKVMEWCLKQAKNPATVLDPFMGSGTTGVACMGMGLKFVGIEITPKYFDIACRRIEDSQRQQRMFS